MGSVSIMGEFEQLVLLAVLRLGYNAYGVTIRHEIEERTGRPINRGAVYATLDRLENKGYLSSYLGEPRPVRKGKSRRYYRLEPEGIEALSEARKALMAMWSGLEPVLGEI